MMGSRMASSKYDLVIQEGDGEAQAVVHEDDLAHMIHGLAHVPDDDYNMVMADEKFFALQDRCSNKFGLLWKLLSYFISSELFFLLVVGGISGILIFLMTLGVEELIERRIEVLEFLPNKFSQYVVWVVMSTVSALISVELVNRISPYAVGSGIPELRTSFRSHVKPDAKFLSARTIVAKLLGLVFASGGGLPVGKEGPSVHLAAAIANVLMNNVPFFRSVVSANNSLRMELLTAACAVGIGTNFTSPVGGVLFSIEVTTSGYFPIRNYWRGFLASVVGATVFAILIAEFEGHEVRPLVPTYFPKDPFAYETKERRKQNKGGGKRKKKGGGGG
jgi:chloride channel 2